MEKLIILFILILGIQSMKISERGAYMIGYFEGFSDTAYWDQWGKVWTIGYGHTGDVHEGDTITRAEALKLLQKDCQYVEGFVNDKSFVPQALNQAQFDALVSFGYNLGPYTLPKLCKGKTIKQIASDILDYCHAGGEVLPGLVKRRKAESYLLLHGITGITEIDSKYPSSSSTEPRTNVKFTYTVMTKSKNYANIADGKTAGKVGQEIIGIAIKASSGSVKYRVHIVGGGWLPYVTGFNLNDYNNGYAGNGKPIDAVQVMHDTVSTKYRVSPKNSNFYSYQIDTLTSNGMDGYAGYFGKAIDRFELTSE